MDGAGRQLYLASHDRRLSISSTPTSARATVAQQKQRGCSMSSTNGSRAATQDLKGWFLELAALDYPIRREFYLFTLLSGCRPTALQETKPSHVDFRRRMVHIPKPKGGAKRAFDIPLSRENDPMHRSGHTLGSSPHPTTSYQQRRVRGFGKAPRPPCGNPGLAWLPRRATSGLGCNCSSRLFANCRDSQNKPARGRVSRRIS